MTTEPADAAAPAMTPAGTATFLFTDIEGSTRLEERIGTARYADAPRAAPRAPARARSTPTAASSRAPRATRSSSSSRAPARRSRRPSTAQRALAAEPWPDDAAVRVRMGLHSGEAGHGRRQPRRARRQPGRADRGGRPRRPDRRLGRDPGAGRRARCPPTSRLRDLGEYRLRDLLAPGAARPGRRRRAAVRVPAAADARRPAEQPADPADDVRRPRRRARRGPPAARDDPPADADRARRDRARPGSRSQLATTVADDFPDGVFFVPLEPIRDPMLVAPRIASAVGVTESAAASRSPSRSTSGWRARRVLLVLDNFEQVVDAGAGHRRPAPRRAGPEGRSPRAGPRSTSPASRSTRCPGLPTPPDLATLSGRRADAACPAAPAASTPPRSASTRRSGCSSSGRSPSGRRSRSPTRTRRPWPPSRPACTACRWPSSWRPRGSSSSRPTRSSPGSSTSSTSSPRAGATCPSASRPCAAPSPGATTCSTTAAGGCSTGCRSSPGRADIDAAEAVAGPSSELGDRRRRRPHGARRPEPRPRRRDRGRRAALRPARVDPRVRGRAARGARRARRRSSSGIATGSSTLAERAAPELSGDDQRRWLDRLELAHDDIRAVLDRAVAQPDPPVAIRLALRDVALLAEARPPRRRRGAGSTAMEAAPWSRDDPRLRARLAGGARRRLLVAGRPRRDAGRTTRRPSRSGKGSATTASWPTPTTTPSFSYAVGPDGTITCR